jgi:hypothetical protein
LLCNKTAVKLLSTYVLVLALELLGVII